jgi:hypothetical protein
MPLTRQDRQFLSTVRRLKAYVLLMASAVFLYLLFVPTNEIQMATSILGLALCGVFWLTQRLLSFISVLDLELTQIMKTLSRILPEEERRALAGKRS